VVVDFKWSLILVLQILQKKEPRKAYNCLHLQITLKYKIICKVISYWSLDFSEVLRVHQSLTELVCLCMVLCYQQIKNKKRLKRVQQLAKHTSLFLTAQCTMWKWKGLFCFDVVIKCCRIEYNKDSNWLPGMKQDICHQRDFRIDRTKHKVYEHCSKWSRIRRGRTRDWFSQKMSTIIS
jgi:hypothetical protein